MFTQYLVLIELENFIGSHMAPTRQNLYACVAREDMQVRKNFKMNSRQLEQFLFSFRQGKMKNISQRKIKIFRLR